MTWDEGDETGDGPCRCFTCRVLYGPSRRPRAFVATWRANIHEAIAAGEVEHGDLARRVMPPLEFSERNQWGNAA